jgi:uncharacterized oxidoreductase
MAGVVDAVTVRADDLEAYACALTRALGAPEDIASQVGASLVGANLAGHDSHGVLLVPYWAQLVQRGQIRPDARPAVVDERGAIVRLDGGLGFGPVAAHAACREVAQRARAHGIACALVRNANHIGRLGEYTAGLAEQGLVALLFVNCQGSGQLLAPVGGVERRLTNNPISIAAPGTAHPVLLDMALSVAAEAKVWLAKARGEPIPDDWILDAAGAPSTNPDALFDGGVLLPLGGLRGGHKGYGLIVLVEILAGVLSGGGICRPGAPEDFSNAFMLIALDASAAVPAEEYTREVTALGEHIRSSARRADCDRILLPGDHEAAAAGRRAADGIPIEPDTWAELLQVGARLGVPPPRSFCRLRLTTEPKELAPDHHG